MFDLFPHCLKEIYSVVRRYQLLYHFFGWRILDLETNCSFFKNHFFDRVYLELGVCFIFNYSSLPFLLEIQYLDRNFTEKFRNKKDWIFAALGSKNWRMGSLGLPFIFEVLNPLLRYQNPLTHNCCIIVLKPLYF